MILYINMEHHRTVSVADKTGHFSLEIRTCWRSTCSTYTICRTLQSHNGWPFTETKPCDLFPACFVCLQPQRCLSLMCVRVHTLMPVPLLYSQVNMHMLLSKVYWGVCGDREGLICKLQSFTARLCICCSPLTSCISVRLQMGLCYSFTNNCTVCWAPKLSLAPV